MIQSEDEIGAGDLLYIDIQERKIFTVSIVVCIRHHFSKHGVTAMTCNSGRYVKHLSETHGVDNWSIAAK